ncbi:hypothetical protein NO1_0229 [Candidatus Termititenax aidoneus]|uniref:Uncharacterized protein n=1 Tax=Termititenax aidoneus TaxID=2218524 RepID=A0A388T892_TERA1|nr:hypothetical protein NO1_0229 [Candidatus Termititenax aidoneus]
MTTLNIEILAKYDQIRPWIDIIQTIIYFLGFVWIINWLRNRQFNLKVEEIRRNLQVRGKIGSLLNEYVYEHHKNGNKDIAVLFVYWKNYPWHLENDGYKFHIYWHDSNGITLPSGFISNTGIYVVEYPWFYSESLYVDKNGMWFVAKKGKQYKGFTETTGKFWIIYELPYSNIINFDFEQDKPIIYIRYKYNSHKLYSNEVRIRNLQEELWLALDLENRNFVQKYHSIKHFWLMFISIFKRRKVQQ